MTNIPEYATGQVRSATAAVSLLTDLREIFSGVVGFFDIRGEQ
jgi:hypothetical protein